MLALRTNNKLLFSFYFIFLVLMPVFSSNTIIPENIKDKEEQLIINSKIPYLEVSRDFSEFWEQKYNLDKIKFYKTILDRKKN
ncbi:MAG: hypothetical protein JXN64_09415 [Spirochaetes bacterium]|nr:hypothetical protein [Spirochaetota bacterium]